QQTQDHAVAVLFPPASAMITKYGCRTSRTPSSVAPVAPVTPLRASPHPAPRTKIRATSPMLLPPVCGKQQHP
ncbi:hypothetical protein ACLQ24_24030, partial [Micromonospora sp. DT4]|uniref:hypothetical protein n=1 Tax=Micromonospora sp. DT4 TaxID=3393438 RepID=UPI003CEE267F